MEVNFAHGFRDVAISTRSRERILQPFDLPFRPLDIIPLDIIPLGNSITQARFLSLPAVGFATASFATGTIALESQRLGIQIRLNKGIQ